MAFTLVSDRLWKEVRPLLPPEAPKPKGGRPRVPDRACLAGIVYVLRTGMPWRFIPIELGCGSGVTCWRRLQEWKEQDVWLRAWRAILAELDEEGTLNWAEVFTVADREDVRKRLEMPV